jgi:hypothetical protein
VEILPWVVGVRGLLDSNVIKSCLKFLEIPRQRWRLITEDAARESVKAFYSLHRVRCKVLKMGRALQLPVEDGACQWSFFHAMMLNKTRKDGRAEKGSLRGANEEKQFS